MTLKSLTISLSSVFATISLSIEHHFIEYYCRYESQSNKCERENRKIAKCDRKVGFEAPVKRYQMTFSPFLKMNQSIFHFHERKLITFQSFGRCGRWERERNFHGQSCIASGDNFFKMWPRQLVLNSKHLYVKFCDFVCAWRIVNKFKIQNIGFSLKMKILHCFHKKIALFFCCTIST